MLFIFIVILTTVIGNSYEEYIELLSEDEKQEFLEKIAKRIMETVQSKENKEKFSRELSDEQLEEHNDFVESIMKEETGNLKKNKDNTKKRGRDNTYENESLKTGDTVDTFEHGNRQRRSSDDKDILKEISTTVDTPTKEVPIKKRSVNTNDDYSENVKPQNESSVEESSVTESQVSNVESTNLELEKNKSQNLHNNGENITHLSKKSNDDILTVTETKNYRLTVKTKASETSIETFTTPKFVESNTNKKVNLDDENNNDNTPTKTMGSETAQTSVFENKAIESKPVILNKSSNIKMETSTKENQLFGEFNEDDDTINPKDNNDKTTMSTVPNNIKTDSKTTQQSISKESTNLYEDEAKINKTVPENPLEKTTKNLHSSENTKPIYETITVIPTETSQSNHNTVVSTEPDLHMNLTKLENSDSPETPTNVLVLTTANIDDVTIKPTSKLWESQKDALNETVVNRVSVQAVTNLKNIADRVIPKVVIEDNNFENKEEHIIDHNSYQVYEIDENQDPFIKNPTKNSHPHSFPIYDYSPNIPNKNLNLKPNIINENSIITEADNLYKRNDKLNEEFMANIYDIIRNFIKKKNKEINKVTDFSAAKTALYDKKQLDFKKTRRAEIYQKWTESKKKKKGKQKNKRVQMMPLPNSGEAFHPHNKKQDITQDHIRAVQTIVHIFKDVKPSLKTRGCKYDQSSDECNERKDFNVKNKLTKETRNNFDDFELVFSRVNGNLLGMFKTNDRDKNKVKETRFKTDDGNAKISKGIMKDVQDMNITWKTRTNGVKIDTYVNVLKNMLQEDNKALKQYDWLGTAVDVRSAIFRLRELINRIYEEKPIHKSDRQILNYVLFLHNFATQFTEANNKLSKKYSSPRNKKKKQRKLKKEDSVKKSWLYLRTLLPDLADVKKLEKFEEFLMEVEDQLFDLHTALKTIASITRFTHQEWFANLKDLYLTSEGKQSREILLHISFARLVELIEHSCQNGLEDDFIVYMKKNRKEAKRTLEEMIFVLKLVNEMSV